MLKAHKYQINAADFAFEKQISYSALDMGLGKTLVALMWAKMVLKHVKGVLVIAPLRTVYATWPAETEKWTPDLTYTILHGPHKDFHIEESKSDLYFINFEGIPWLLEALKVIFTRTKKLPFRAMIIDEAVCLKSHSSKRFKAMKVLTDVAPTYKLMLCGTPAPNSLLDLWAQYYILDKGARLGTSFTAFRAEYFKVMDRNGFVWRIKPDARDKIQNKIADITFRLDAKDYLEIPELVLNKIPIILPPKTMETYKELKKELVLELGSNIIEAASASAMAMKLRQLVQGGLYTTKEKDPLTGERPFEIIHKAKLDALSDIVEASNGRGILCAIQFRFELQMIKEKFKNTPHIASGVSAKEITYLIDKWNAGEIPLLLCNPMSLSEGVNLQYGSNIIVWYCLPWSLQKYLQFNARLHRQNQTETVIVHHLIAKNTIDEVIMAALDSKFENQNQLLEFLKQYLLRERECL